MITVFTPMIMINHDWLLRSDEPMSRRVTFLGVLLCLYPLGQLPSPVLGALYDRFGRRPGLMTSLHNAVVVLFTKEYVLLSEVVKTGFHQSDRRARRHGEPAN